MKISTSVKKYLLTISAIVVVFILYEILHLCSENKVLVPSIWLIFKQLINIFTSIEKLKLLLMVILKTLIVIFIALILSIAIGLIISRFRMSSYFIRVFINILKAAPFAIISIYLFYALFKQRNIISLIVSFLVVFPLCYEGVEAAIKNIKEEIRDELALLPISGLRKYIDVYLPMSLPYITVTFLQSFGLGIKVMVMAEYISLSKNSLGKLINDIKSGYDETAYAEMLAWLILLVLIVCIFDLLVSIINSKLNPVRKRVY